MAGRPFHRLDSNDHVYHSASPSQEFDIGSYPSGLQNPSRNYSPDHNNDYATYMNNQNQQQQQHYGPGFQSPFSDSNQTTYQPVGQYMEEEKRPLRDRTYTEASNRSRQSSHSSRLFAPFAIKPWHHKKDHNTGTTRVFSKWTQARKTLIHGIFQWLPPAIFSSCMAIILYSYDKQSIITHREKYTFNALLLGFTLLLGFSVQSSFKLYADLMRWRWLASDHWDLRTFERIMGSSSQRTVVKLLWSGRNRGSIIPSRVQVVCFIYLFFAVGLQVVIACLGLCYTVENSNTQFGWVWGNTTVVDLSAIRLVASIPGLSEFEDFLIQTGAANTYGLTSTQYTIKQNPQKNETNYGGTIYTNTDNSRYWYQFLSHCSSPDCNDWQSTERKITATASCQLLNITNDGGYLDESNITWTGSAGQKYWFDFYNTPVSGTTSYASYMNEACGPRCTTMYVVNTGWNKNVTGALDHPPQFYTCNSTLSGIDNIPYGPGVNQSLYTMPDLQARILAGSIGFAGSFSTGSDWQMKNYAYRSYWSWDLEPRTATEMAQYIAQYTIGAVAAMDQSAARVYAMGPSPTRAIQVNVKWMFTVLVLVSVPGVQLLFLFYVIWFTRHVVIRDGSYLSNARLLRPIANDLGDKGCAMDGDDIADVLDNMRISYGVRLPPREAVQTGYSHGIAGPLMHLDILRQGDPQLNRVDAWHPGMPMPEGRYDGYENPLLDRSTCVKFRMNRTTD